MSSATTEHDAAGGAGVWWDGVLNPMTMDGLKSALSEEGSDTGIKGSDIRWVAWPGPGQQVHVSQVDELRPIWVDIELRRVKNRVPLTFLPLFWVLVDLLRAHDAGALWMDWSMVALTLLGWMHAFWSYQRIKYDPRGWGLVRSRADARRAGLVSKA